MNKDHKSLSEQREKVHTESQSPLDNAKIGEPDEGVEKARQAIIELRRRRRKRTVIIK
jgi:hypothetical protein